MLGFKQMAILLASSSGEIITGGGSRGYVVWDPNILKEGLVQISDKVGTAFNVGIWMFLGITGLYSIISIVRSLFG